MRRVSSLLSASILIATLSTSTFAGSITTLRGSRVGSITTLSTGSITTLRSGSITTLRSGVATTPSAIENPQELDRISMAEFFGNYVSMFFRALW